MQFSISVLSLTHKKQYAPHSEICQAVFCFSALIRDNRKPTVPFGQDLFSHALNKKDITPSCRQCQRFLKENLYGFPSWLFRGGAYGDGAPAGLLAFHVTSDASDTGVSIGFRLCNSCTNVETWWKYGQWTF